VLPSLQPLGLAVDNQGGEFRLCVFQNLLQIVARHQLAGLFHGDGCLVFIIRACQGQELTDPADELPALLCLLIFARICCSSLRQIA